MEFDPVNRDVPAPRYELESGSEDEFEQGDRPAAGTETREFFRIISAHDSSSSVTLQTDTQLVVLIGNAGAALLSSLQGSAPAELYSLRTETDQHASIAVVDSASSKITAALVAPPPHLRSSRFHDIAQTLVEAVQPSSIVIVDSYSPQEQLYRDPYSDDAEDRVDDTIRYLATPSYLEQNKVDARGLTPLRSPEAASGLGAAFLSKAVVSNISAILTLLEDVSFQSHVQLYGSLGAARLSPAASETLSSLTGLDGKEQSRTPSGKSILDFAASRRIKPASNLAVLGDGNMYI